MSVVGPTRLVLLRAGKYDYGEVELTRPLHLVGPNNVGKTSLIAALQFLYIDDQRHMHFARDLADTRRYYFPDPSSYVLFECLTPTGFQVFGVQGLGPLKQYEFQRFAYRGRFEAEDFLDAERRVRDPGEIRARLAPRGYTLLEPRHLRAALSGIGESRGVHLGLVPLRHRDHYGRFRAMFRNLLRLAHLRQEELKEFFVEIHQAEFQQAEIDLERDYAGQYEKVRRGAAELADLRAVEEEARRLLEAAGRRRGLRRELPALWSALRAAYARDEAEDVASEADLAAHRTQATGRHARTEEERRGLQEDLRRTAEERGALGERLRELDAQAAEFGTFLAPLEAEKRDRLEVEAQALAARLHQAEAESAHRLEARLARNEAELARKRDLRARLSGALAGRLLGTFTSEELETLFRLWNPALLGLPAAPGGVELRDSEALEARLREILQRIDAGTYADAAVRVELGAVPAPDLAEYAEPVRIDERIAELADEVERDRAALEARREADRLRARVEALRRERDGCARRLLRYEEYREKLSRAEGWRARNGELGLQEGKLGERLAELDRLRDELAGELRRLGGEEEALGERRRRREEAVRRLAPPPVEWEEGPAPQLPGDLLEDLHALAARYVEGSREERRLTERVEDGLRAVRARTYGRLDRETEEESLAALAEELEAVAEKARAVQALWKGLAAGLTSAFRALARDLETLESRVDELNRALAKVSVSNLARLRLLVKEHPEWTRRLRTVSVEEEMPLFGDRKAVDEALGQLGELLSHYPRVRLLDLFHLHFEVTAPDGAVSTYPHLDTIESHGTTITIKVLINLLLLRGLLGRKEVSLPFYLDEVASLDHENLSAIVEKAQELGFVPALASPEAMDAADHLYFLAERQGRVLLEPRTSLVRIHRDGGEGQEETGNVADGP